MKRGGWLLAFVTAGALVRIVLLRAPEIWYDEATTGLMGLAVLRGDFPLYFYGQPFMGALDAYLAAPLYLTLGVSVRVLKVLPLVLVLVWMALTVRLAWEGFGRRAATFTAALLALPPDFLLSWSVEARTHYQMSVVLGTLALLLALRISASPRRAVLAGFGVLGGVLGLAFWTHFLSLVFWPPVALLLCRRRLRRLIPGLAIAAGGFTLGSLPHWVYGLQHGTALPPPGSWIGLAQIFDNLGLAARVSWPVIAGVPESLRERWPGVFLAAALAVSYALAVALAARAARRAGPRARSVGLTLGALVVVNVSVAVATQYGQRLDDPDQRYLLPVYTALPVLLGGGLAELPLAAGAALAVGLLVVQGAACATETLQGLAPAAVARVEAERRAQLEAIALMEKQGPARLYSDDPGMRILTFLSRERVIVSDPYEENYPPYARLVDGAETVGWWLRGRGPGLGESLTALGAQFETRHIGDIGGTFADFALTPQALRELDPATLTVTASLNGADAGSMVDRDAATFWSSGQPKRGGEWFQVDLGRVEPVALIRWLPRSYQEIPAGLVVETSLDAVTWQRLIVLPEYQGPLYWSAGHPVARVRSGRVELRVPPTPARYLRVTQTGQAVGWYWTVRELFVYAADPGAVPTPPRADGVALARTVRAAGVTRLYADRGWASRVALVDPELRVPPANLALDAYNDRGPESELLPEMPWSPGVGGAGGGARCGRVRQRRPGERARVHARRRRRPRALRLRAGCRPSRDSDPGVEPACRRLAFTTCGRPGGRREPGHSVDDGPAAGARRLAPRGLRRAPHRPGRPSLGDQAQRVAARPPARGLSRRGDVAAADRRAPWRERDPLGRHHAAPQRPPGASSRVRADHAPRPPPDPDRGTLALRVVRQRADRVRRRLTATSTGWTACHAATVPASPCPRMLEVSPSLSVGASSGWRKQRTSPRCS